MSSSSKSALRDVSDWQKGQSCTLTALSALSGRPSLELAALLAQAAAEEGRVIPPDPRRDYARRDWLRAIELLGGDAQLADDYSGDDFAQRPAMFDWIIQNKPIFLTLLHCTDGAECGHVFAAHEGMIVDNFTSGKVTPASVSPPADYPLFRVERTYQILLLPEDASGHITERNPSSLIESQN